MNGLRHSVSVCSAVLLDNFVVCNSFRGNGKSRGGRS